MLVQPKVWLGPKTVIISVRSTIFPLSVRHFSIISREINMQDYAINGTEIGVTGIGENQVIISNIDVDFFLNFINYPDAQGSIDLRRA